MAMSDNPNMIRKACKFKGCNKVIYGWTELQAESNLASHMQIHELRKKIKR